tara:strand:+ start:10153 stop:11616 length:1464 start_codon:yes stop_codon:yes gene_type:complete
MPTIVNITVAPSGGDYTSLNTALASIPTSIVATDEQYNISCETFTGGLAESVTIPSITQDATRHVHIQAAVGHEYNHVDDSGFYITASVSFSATLVNSVNFTRFSNIGIKNTRTLSNGRGFDNFGNDCVITNVYAETLSTTGAIVYYLNNANNLDISYCIANKGTTGFDFGNYSTKTADHLTAVNQISVGFDTGTANTTLTNSLTIGASDPYLGTFNVASDYNACDSTDAPGANSLQNRTSADFKDFAGGDYRTSQSSILATSGLAGDFIGFALESSSSILITIDSLSQSQTLEQINLTQLNNLIINSLAQEQYLDESSITQNNNLAINDLSQQQAINEISLTQAYILTLNNLSQSQLLDSINLTQLGTISLDDLLQNQSLEQIVLNQSSILTVNDLTQSQNIDKTALTYAAKLLLNSLSQSQSIDEITLSALSVVTVDSLSQSQIIDAINFGGVVVGYFEGELSIVYAYNNTIMIQNALTGDVSIL